MLYYEIFLKNRTVSRRAILAVKIGVRRSRAQRTIIYNILRVFHRVLASRLEASLPNHEDQVGFKRPDGISHNVVKLNAALHTARAKHKNLVIVSVDIRKVFDSVSHVAKLGILQRKEVPDLLTGYLRSYFGTSSL